MFLQQEESVAKALGAMAVYDVKLMMAYMSLGLILWFRALRSGLKVWGLRLSKF